MLCLLNHFVASIFLRTTSKNLVCSMSRGAKRKLWQYEQKYYASLQMCEAAQLLCHLAGLLQLTANDVFELHNIHCKVSDSIRKLLGRHRICV